MRDQVRALGIEPRDDERTRHQALRERDLVAERQRRDVATFAHTSIRAISSSISSRSRPLRNGTTSFAASTIAAPRASANSATTSIAAAFSSTRNTSASSARELVAKRARGRRDCQRRGRRPRRALRRGARRGRRAPDGGAVQKYATERPRTSAAGRGRRTVATTRDLGTARHRATASRVRSQPAPVLAHRHDDDVGAKEPNAFEVAGRDGRVLVPAHDDDRPVGRDRRKCGAAAVEDDEIGAELERDPGAGSDVRGERRPRPARRRSGGSRPSRPRRAQPSRDGRTRRGVRCAKARGAPRPSAEPRSSPARPARRAPSRRRRRVARGERSRARWPVTAVLPTRFPVPTTAIDGSSNGSSSGGSRRKSAPAYGMPRREDPAREREPLDGPEHRLVREIDDDLRPVALDRRTRRPPRAERRTPRRRAASPATDENRRDELVRKLGERVADDGRVVLAVDDRERPHVLAVTSSSIAPVNFAYSSVSSENDTSFTLAVERMPPPDVDLPFGDLDDVVTGPRVAREGAATRRCPR